MFSSSRHLLLKQSSEQVCRSQHDEIWCCLTDGSKHRSILAEVSTEVFLQFKTNSFVITITFTFTLHKDICLCALFQLYIVSIRKMLKETYSAPVLISWPFTWHKASHCFWINIAGCTGNFHNFPRFVRFALFQRN